MTTIKTTCPGCGEVELAGDGIKLMVCPSAPLSYYTFVCPRCTDRVRKPADDRIVSLLISGGVHATTWEIPAEALEMHAGPRLGYDDLLDFALWLGMADDLARLAAAAPIHH